MHRVIRLAFAVSLFFAATMLWAQQEFSADLVNHLEGKDITSTGKVYVGKDKLRFESAERQGHSGAIIINLATQTNDIIMPERKMYMEMPQGQGPGAQRTWNFFRVGDVDSACTEWLKMPHNQGGSCKKIGSETVNGRSTVKYEATNAQGDTSYVWIDPKIAFPIKWQNKNGSGELQNIKEGSQPASLFEIPSDYQKMQMPMGMPNMPQRPQ